MEDDILDALEHLGYKGSLLNSDGLKKAIDDGPKSVEYTKAVEWLSKELRAAAKLEDHINAISCADDSSSFLLEVSSFLKELGCPHRSLTEGNVSQRLQTTESRQLLLVFLGTELEAARIIEATQPSDVKGMEVEVQESSTANDLKTTLIALGFSKPPDNITAQQLFSKLEAKVRENMSKLPPKLISKPLFTGVLSDKQWQAATQLQDEMKQEYRLRREMLLKRLDVTIQSFQWSGRAKNKMDEIAAVFGKQRRLMAPEPKVDLADLLAAREDLTILEKTSNANVRRNTKSSINQVIIGRVPDRGGRPSEQQAPPPEMPSWQKRTDAPQGGGSGGRGGGRVQGGWSNDRSGGERGGGGYRGGGRGRGGGGRGGHRHQDQYGGGRGGYQGDYQQYGGGGTQQFGHPSYSYDAAGTYYGYT